MYLSILLSIATPSHAMDYVAATLDPEWHEQNIEWLSRPQFFTSVSNTNKLPQILEEYGYSHADATKYGCRYYQVVRPDEDERGDLAAARLTPPAYPPAYPFVVESVGYTLLNSTSFIIPFDACDAGLAHRVYVFVNAGWDLEPTLVETIEVPASEKLRSTVELRHDIEPLTLNEGEHLLVAVEMVGTASSSMCMPTCQDHGWWRRYYWSKNGAPDAPPGVTYSWHETGGAPWSIYMWGLAPGKAFVSAVAP